MSLGRADLRVTQALGLFKFPALISYLLPQATGASEEDVQTMLAMCNYDANETTSRLLESAWVAPAQAGPLCGMHYTHTCILPLHADPFSQVVSKKDKKLKKDEERKRDPPPPAKFAETRRGPGGTSGRGRGGDRGDRGDRGASSGGVTCVLTPRVSSRDHTNVNV